MIKLRILDFNTIVSKVMSKYAFEPQKYKKELIEILDEVRDAKRINHRIMRSILHKNPKDGNQLFSKDHLVRGYDYLINNKLFEKNELLEERIQMKPTRTISGVVPITVLTKPFHCPGECIFCPLERNMPKSYLRNEPGAQRAEQNNFNPYMQVYNRLQALKNIGHNTEKAELIILGGTWSYYPKPYQIWFIKEMFRALNDFDVREPDKQFEPKGKDNLNEEKFWQELLEEHKKNEDAKSRSVGLSIETRPDFLDEAEIIRIRKLGCTKVQIGVQSMDDKVLEMNKRGHNAEKNIEAADLLRKAGFKVQIHYMPNLYGSTPDIDIKGYKALFETNNVMPDELKLYPCSIIKNTELYDIWEQGKYKPYTEAELLYTLVESLKYTPQYTRLTRVIRDIPSDDIVVGNKKTNFREIVERELIKRGTPCTCIRCREIKRLKFDPEKLKLDIIKYSTRVSHEHFLQYVTEKNEIVGFLRLSIPKSKINFIAELDNAALIREVHVYGTSLNIDEKKTDAVQHLGLGTKLIDKAKEITRENGFEKLSVISAIGTRNYYRKKGFEDGELYQYVNFKH